MPLTLSSHGPFRWSYAHFIRAVSINGRVGDVEVLLELSYLPFHHTAVPFGCRGGSAADLGRTHLFLIIFAESGGSIVGKKDNVKRPGWRGQCRAS